MTAFNPAGFHVSRGGICVEQLGDAVRRFVERYHRAWRGEKLGLKAPLEARAAAVMAGAAW